MLVRSQLFQSVNSYTVNTPYSMSANDWTEVGIESRRGTKLPHVASMESVEFPVKYIMSNLHSESVQGHSKGHSACKSFVKPSISYGPDGSMGMTGTGDG